LDQVANDKINGVTVGPDGNKIKVLVLGPVRRTRRAVPYFARRVRRLDVSRTARDRAGGGGLSADMRPHEQQPKPVKP
ncbi:MAG TPA: hypothetical protein VHW66_24435, partial [Stellaceae bacterium]|nr:hypothetical protein [Stellaceae bacterium]